MATEIMNYEAEFKKIAEQVKDTLTQPIISHISTKGKLFTLPDGQTSPLISCIVLDFIRINTLMPPYNPNIRTNPKCWAYGRNDLTLKPSIHCPEKQAESCNECKHNKFGSATTGKGKACANTYRLAIIPPDATTITMLKVSPTGLEKWRRYVVLTTASFGPGGFCKVITEIKFDPNRDYPSLIFTATKPVENPETILALCERAREEIFTEPLMS